MSDTSFRVEQLSNQPGRTVFSCGVEALDRYLKQQASQDLKRKLAVVYLLIDSATNAIAGYYTLSSFSIDVSSVPEEQTRKVGRYPVVPAILIGRLARDLMYRGKGIGELLLADALQRAQSLSSQMGAWAVVVDAKDAHARQFYESFGFLSTVDDEHRLFLPMKTIEESLRPTGAVTRPRRP